MSIYSTLSLEVNNYQINQTGKSWNIPAEKKIIFVYLGRLLERQRPGKGKVTNICRHIRTLLSAIVVKRYPSNPPLFSSGPLNVRTVTCLVSPKRGKNSEWIWSRKAKAEEHTKYFLFTSFSSRRKEAFSCVNSPLVLLRGFRERH